MDSIKNQLKKIVTTKSLYYHYLYLKKPSLFFINYLFQRVLRVDADCPFIKHYTSTVLFGENIVIDWQKPEKILKSFFCSGGCYIQAENGIQIGSGTFWSVNVVMASAAYELDTYMGKTIGLPIRIGKDCWIGANSVILPGVQLGDHIIVGAGSVVTHSFPQGHCVIAGSPAKIIKSL